MVVVGIVIVVVHSPTVPGFHLTRTPVDLVIGCADGVPLFVTAVEAVLGGLAVMESDGHHSEGTRHWVS